MRKRNMLQSADGIEEFIHLSEKEIAGSGRNEYEYFEGIPEYGNDDAPSAEDIAVVEKVLKYASQCEYMGFTGADARLVMSCSTHVLRWALNHECQEGDE